MEIKELIILILAFIVPITYQRIHFTIKRNHFEKISNVREKSGLQIHHGHWGVLIVFITSIYTIFLNDNIYSHIAFMYGWGLITDEIIPALKTPSNDRESELKIYSDAKKSTLILISVIILILIILFLTM